MKNLYPVYINLHNKKCVVIGGGEVAQRKIISLLDSCAIVTVVSPVCTTEILTMVEEGKINYIPRGYTSADLEGAFLVISATDNEQVNTQVAADCFHKGIMVNVVDAPELCNFFVPAVVRRGDLSISISTGGNSPLLARRVKKLLEQQFGEEYEEFLEIMGQVRQQVLAKYDDPAQRKEIFQRLVDSDILMLLKDGKKSLAKGRVEECLLSLSD